MSANARSSPNGLNWVGNALDGSGGWTLRSKVPYILGLMMLFDSWDSVVIAYTLPSIIAEWDLSGVAAGFLISAGYGGQFLGAIAFGTLAEKRGRLPILRWLVAIMGALAVVCSMAATYEQLMAVRFIQGIAIGGALPVVICYVNEVAPRATRGKFFGTYQFLMLAGYGLASIASIKIVPDFGWRTMFAIGVIPLFLMPLLFLLPESPRWLAGQGRAKDAANSLAKLGSSVGPLPKGADSWSVTAAPKVPVRELIAPGVRRTTYVVAGLWFFTSLVSFGLVTWVPSIYVEMFGIPVEKALAYNSYAAVSIFILPIVLRQTIDKIGRRPPAIIGTTIAGIALFGMLIVPSDLWLVVVALLIIAQIGVSVSSMLVWPYTAEIYDTRVRAVALGAASSLARGAAMLTPLVVGGILDLTNSVMLVFVIFGTSCLAVAVLWWRGATETAGREMDG